MGSINNRLKKIERLQVKTEPYNDVLELIKQGAFYDELTVGEQWRYTEYISGKGVRPETLESIMIAVNEMRKSKGSGTDAPLHFILTEKEEPWTTEQVAEEVEKIINGHTGDYSE